MLIIDVVDRFADIGPGTGDASDCAGDEEIYQWVGDSG